LAHGNPLNTQIFDNHSVLALYQGTNLVVPSLAKKEGFSPLRCLLSAFLPVRGKAMLPFSAAYKAPATAIRPRNTSRTRIWSEKSPGAKAQISLGQ
jgi:hypothetical protein